MIDVLARADTTSFHVEPFPHLVIDGALDADVYAALSAQFPTLDVVKRHAERAKNNHLYLLSAREIEAAAGISTDWKAFFRYHVSTAFWRSALALVRPHLTALHPRLEQIAGRPLEAFRTVVRDYNSPFDEEISLDCQFGTNSPVTRASSVRSPHLDRPSKLFNALLYCRTPEDDTPGGELVLYRAIAPLLYAQGSSILQTRVAPAKRIAYRANRLVLFLNSPRSVHGVSPRPKTPHVRRYVNFLCEFRENLFELERASPLTRIVDSAVTAVRSRSELAIAETV
ncbi:MAG TPA: 2OG-Fe(II) oxygenase [Pseudomonadales bacterium]|nr:2OG-Fe(II) oxygenase [Pseudomonadales bacterium]